MIGQWGLIPWFAKEQIQKDQRGRALMTNNARSETIATRPTFRDAWKSGLRCLVPAEAFLEPYWGPVDALFGKCAWWTFSRADGDPWMIAGLYNDWKDPETGEIVPSYTMVTMNADHHPLMMTQYRAIKAGYPDTLVFYQSTSVIARGVQCGNGRVHRVLQARQPVPVPTVHIGAHAGDFQRRQLENIHGLQFDAS